MNTLFRNFIHTFRRFVTASLLNILGLSMAFAAFYLIMTQVDYDFNYNKELEEYRNIYRFEQQNRQSEGWATYTPRPLGEMIDSLSSHITATAIFSPWYGKSQIEVDGHTFEMPVMSGVNHFVRLFRPQMLSGKADALMEPGKVLIPESIAQKLFGTADATDKTIWWGRQSDNNPVTVGGVYKDFPENCFVSNCIYIYHKDQNRGEWSNWNYAVYIRVDDPAVVPDLEKQLSAKLNEDMPEGQKNRLEVRFSPVSETYFSGVYGGDSGNRSVMYVLICASLLILLVAGVNFTNFTLAETPMRLRSINTQKVLGVRVAVLRSSLVGETVLITLISYVLMLVWLHIFTSFDLSHLVEASVSLGKHVGLLLLTLVLALGVGVAAGLYPAWYVTSFPPALVLKGSYGLSPRGRILRTALVGFQFVVSFVLIIGVGLMYLQSHFIRTSDYGFDKEQILVGRHSAESRKQLEAVRAELLTVTGVEGVAFSNNVIGASDVYMGWGRGNGSEHEIHFDCLPVDWQYLRVMGIKVTEGRDFTSTDGDTYIFNEAARATYPWLKVGELATTDDHPVVGFCENVKYCSLRENNIQKPLAFFIYGEYYKKWPFGNVINVRVGKQVDKLAVMKALQQKMEKFTPDYDFNFRFLDEAMNRNYEKETRFMTQILLFSILAIVISLMGVFGLTLFESEYRRKEIGIRKIMGSTTYEILMMFNRRYFYLLIVSFVLAAPLAWWLCSNWLESFAERTSIAWWLFLLSFLLVAVITVITVSYQSWKNANENPILSIKTE